MGEHLPGHPAAQDPGGNAEAQRGRRACWPPADRAAHLPPGQAEGAQHGEVPPPAVDRGEQQMGDGQQRQQAQRHPEQERQVLDPPKFTRPVGVAGPWTANAPSRAARVAKAFSSDGP